MKSLKEYLRLFVHKGPQVVNITSVPVHMNPIKRLSTLITVRETVTGK